MRADLPARADETVVNSLVEDGLLSDRLRLTLICKAGTPLNPSMHWYICHVHGHRTTDYHQRTGPEFTKLLKLNLNNFFSKFP